MSTLGPATKFRICRHGSHKVTGHVNFRDDFDVALLSVSHNFLDFFLCIEVRTVGFVCPVVAIVHIYRPRVSTCRANGSEFGVTLDFYAPTLVVGQVPVETVHLIHRHDVEHTLYFFYGKEVARHVEHETAVTKAGFIADTHEGKGISSHRLVLHTCHHVGGKNLLQRLEGIVETSTCCGFNLYTLSSNVKVVSFSIYGRFGKNHLDERSGIITCCSSIERCCQVDGIHKLCSFSS